MKVRIEIFNPQKTMNRILDDDVGIFMAETCGRYFNNRQCNEFGVISKAQSNVPLLRKQYQDQPAATRFVGLGNPAESGAHLLYVFRQVNALPKDYFADLMSAFEETSRTRAGEIEYQIRDASVNRIVFDDIKADQARKQGNIFRRVKKNSCGRSGKFLS